MSASLLTTRPTSYGTSSAMHSGCCGEPKTANACFHCQTPLTEFANLTAIVDQQTRSVCCHGCKSAAEFIDQQGLTDFYRERDSQRVTGHGPSNVNHDLGVDDWGLIQNGHRCSIRLFVPAIYCNSCAWLIRKTLEDLAQHLSIGLNVQVYSDTKEVSVSWESNDAIESHLASILDRLHNLGYPARPLNAERSRQNAASDGETEMFLKRILVAGLGTMQVMTYAIAHYLGAEATPDIARFLELFSMLVATVVVLFSGQYFFANAWRDLKNRHLGMDVPVALAVGSAFFLSTLQTLMQWEGRVLYYDSAVMFVFFLLVGRYVEARVRHRLLNTAEALNTVLPSSITVRRKCGKSEFQEVVIPPRSVEQGDTVNLAAGEVVPLDGIIIKGMAEFDESLVTGESRPVLRLENEQVLASMRLVAGEVTVQCTRAWSDSSLASLQTMIDGGLNLTHPAAQRMATISRYFVLSILVITVLVGAIWAVFDPSRTFEVVLAMLIASCPCAFALAAPIGSTAASHVLRKHGVLLANGDALTTLARAKQWWFDKTGTLTKGAPEITQIVVSPELSNRRNSGECVEPQSVQDRCLDVISALEAPSRHPLANAFASRHSNVCVQQWQEQAGCGVMGMIDGEWYYVGKYAWVKKHILVEKEKDLNERWLHRWTGHGSQIYLANSTQILACVDLHDTPRNGLQALMDHVRGRAQTVLISGDTQASVGAFAQQVSFDRCFAEQTPEQKWALIRSSDVSLSPNVVVGDGANDAPMLACGDVAVAFASGSELSQAQADVVILSKDLSSLVLLDKVARLSSRVVSQNMVWAIGYNVAILPLAAWGLLTPWIAAIGMSLSSLIVVLNASRIAHTRGLWK